MLWLHEPQPHRRTGRGDGGGCKPTPSPKKERKNGGSTVFWGQQEKVGPMFFNGFLGKWLTAPPGKKVSRSFMHSRASASTGFFFFRESFQAYNSLETERKYIPFQNTMEE